MHLLPVHITSEQRSFLFDRKDRTKLDVAIQVREAIDDYIIKHKEKDKDESKSS